MHLLDSVCQMQYVLNTHSGIVVMQQRIVYLSAFLLEVWRSKESGQWHERLPYHDQWQ